MGVMFLKKIILLFLLISVSFLSASFADGAPRFQNNLAEQALDTTSSEEIMPSEWLHDNEEETTTHQERLLKANTKDYGHYDPAPALVKPPFKLIPN